MTDQELCAAVAEKVLGWKRAGDERCVLWQMPGSGPNEFNHQAAILTWEGVGLILEAMGKHGFYCRIDSPFLPKDEPYWAGFTPYGITGWNGRPDFREAHESAPHAVALAALKAVEAA